MSKSKKTKSTEFQDTELFEVLEKARKQYDTYIELSSFEYKDEEESQPNLIRRDINHPLNIVLK